MCLDFPDRHAPGVHGYDLAVKAVTTLNLPDQLGLIAALAVAGTDISNRPSFRGPGSRIFDIFVKKRPKAQCTRLLLGESIYR